MKKPVPETAQLVFSVQARLVQELGLAQEPHGVAGGNPVGVVVLGVAVAGETPFAPLSNVAFISRK